MQFRSGLDRGARECLISTDVVRPKCVLATPNPLMSTSRFLLSCLLILTASMVVRIGVAVWWQDRLATNDQQFAMGDSESYWFLARQLAADQPYFYNTPEASVFRTPGYPWLLSWIVQPTPPIQPEHPDSRILAARILGCALGTFAVAVTILISSLLFDRTSALISGLLASFYPGAITTSVLVLSEAPFMPLMMLVLASLCYSIYQPKRAYRGAALAGILSGLAILVRPSWLLFMPFYYLIRFLIAQEKWREFKLAVVAGSCIALVMSPWWIRNYQVTGHFVLTTLQVGASLYDGLSPEATGGSDSGMLFSGEFATKLRTKDETTPGPKDNFEFRLNRELTGAAIQWTRENPGQAVLLSFKKFYRTWWPLPSVQEIPGGFPTRLVFAIGMLGILIPALLHKSVRRLFNAQNHFLPFLVPLLYFTLLHMVFVGSIRYRQPAIFALTIVAAPVLVQWTGRLIGSRRRELSVANSNQ